MSCYVIASKYSENDPNIPELNKYLKALAECTHYTYTLTLEELSKGEIIALQCLDYNLNCFSLYHFVTYFFAHGVIFEPKPNLTGLNKAGAKHNNNQTSHFSKANTKLLEKIYIQSRELLDFIIEDPRYCIAGKETVIGAMEILRKAINLNVGSTDNPKDVFNEIYHIDEYVNIKHVEAIRKLVNKVYIIKTLKQQDDTSRSTGEGNDNTKQIPERDNQNMQTETIQSPIKNLILSLNTHKGINQQRKNKGNKINLNNVFDLNQLSIKKRALSSTKEKEEKQNIVYAIKNKVIYNNPIPIPFNKEQLAKQTNPSIDPLFQQYNKRPPVKSIRIKKDLIEADKDEHHYEDILANSTKNTIKNLKYDYVSNPKKEQQDILDMTKKIFEQSKRNKIDQRDTHYSSNDVNRYKLQSQTVNDLLNSQQSYNTIIINNNININTFIEKKGTFDSNTHNVHYNYNEKKYDVSHTKVNQYQACSSSLIKGKNYGGIKQNYFGTYFDYDNDSLINKTVFNNQKGDLLNSSEIKRIYKEYMV